LIIKEIELGKSIVIFGKQSAKNLKTSFICFYLFELATVFQKHRTMQIVTK